MILLFNSSPSIESMVYWGVCILFYGSRQTAQRRRNEIWDAGCQLKIITFKKIMSSADYNIICSFFLYQSQAFQAPSLCKSSPPSLSALWHLCWSSNASFWPPQTFRLGDQVSHFGSSVDAGLFCALDGRSLFGKSKWGSTMISSRMKAYVKYRRQGEVRQKKIAWEHIVKSQNKTS